MTLDQERKVDWVVDKMEDCHETMERLFGGEFQIKARPYMEEIKKVMKRDRCCAVTATLHLCKRLEAQQDSGPIVMVMAACVELARREP